MRTGPLAAAAVIALAGCHHEPALPDGANAVVQRVVDGDTIDVRIEGRTERVRLLGIDTPESVGDRPPECWGKEASHLTDQLLPKGTAVRLERDQEARDAYGRLLAYVTRVPDGLLVNLVLAERGAADALIIPPNTGHAAEVAAAVAAARATGAGLWGACGGPDEPLAATTTRDSSEKRSGDG
ncbi:MAG TPA: thermonuclease family protein [Acidimicrobiales bacterium]